MTKLDARQIIGERLLVFMLRDERTKDNSLPNIVRSVKEKTGHEVPSLRARQIQTEQNDNAVLELITFNKYIKRAYPDVFDEACRHVSGVMLNG